MKIMLGMLLNLLESLDQIVNEEARSATNVLKDLFVKLNGRDGDTWWEMIKKFLRKEPCWVMTVLQRLIEAGKYDDVNPNITEKNFPVPENYAPGSDPKIFHFDRNISSEDVVKEMDKVGYEPAMIWDLLDFGANNPEEQRKFPIVGLVGSVGKVGDDRRVPFLFRSGSERCLSLDWWGGGWIARYRFLGVRKKVSQASVS